MRIMGSTLVGDRLDNDIAPAKRLGMRTIRILQSYYATTEPRSPDEEPDATVASLSEIPLLLAGSGADADAGETTR
jgi:FMN phosphatase YigB (HAD superfamily)